MNFQTQRAKMGGGGELHQSISLKFQNTHHVEKSKNFQKKKKKKKGYRRQRILLASNFLTVTLEVRRKQSNAFKILKEN